MISAILLSAGQSKRMGGKNKLTEKIQNNFLIQHSVNNILESPVDELIVVLGHEKEMIEKIIEKNEKIKFVFNKNFKEGMASSIKTGLNHLSKKTEFFFICLGDMPLVNKNIYKKILESKKNFEIIIPTYKGAVGNPVLFSISMINEIKSLEGDVGAKKIFHLHKEKITQVEVNDLGITKDFNTKESFNF